MLCLANKLENALKRLWRFRLSLSACHGGKTSNDLSADSWFSVSGTQIWSNSSNMDPLQQFRLAVFSPSFWHQRGGLVSSFHSSRDFLVCHNSCPSPSHQLPQHAQSVCLLQPGVPCLLPCPPAYQGLWEALYPVGGMSLHLHHLNAFLPLCVPFIFLSCVFFSFLYFSFYLLLVVPYPSS